MADNQIKLTLHERYFLTFLKFKTNNNHQFFGSNEYIAKNLNVAENTVKNMIAKLIKLGFITRDKQENGKRLLSYTGLEFNPVCDDMSIIDKRFLKQEVGNYKSDVDYYKKLYEDLKVEYNKIKSAALEVLEENEKLKQQLGLINSDEPNNETDANSPIVSNAPFSLNATPDIQALFNRFGVQ